MKRVKRWGGLICDPISEMNVTNQYRPPYQERRRNQSSTFILPLSRYRLWHHRHRLVITGTLLIMLLAMPFFQGPKKCCTHSWRTSLVRISETYHQRTMPRRPRRAFEHYFGGVNTGGGVPMSTSFHTSSSAMFLASKRSSSSTTTKKKRWMVGDNVSVLTNSYQNGDDDEMILGRVTSVRGSGWYSILLYDTEETISCRAGQLASYDGSVDNRKDAVKATDINDPVLNAARNSNPDSFVTDALSSANAVPMMPSIQYEIDNTTDVRGRTPMTILADPGTPPDFPPPPPTIYDLDSAIMQHIEDHSQYPQDKEYLQQLIHHSSFEKWVVFTDLHCSSATLATCLQTLDLVHSVAVQHGAGVLFLGDFWHHRGTLRVDCLNAVLKALKNWTVPMVMIPGNHDQVTLGGHSHGLTPLENAYRVGGVPGPLILSHPSLFRKGLFVPHIRDVATMESILQSSLAKDATALFVHAEVKGALMNDLLVSMHGIPPSSFPKHKLIYSGHFHKPHLVQAANQHKATIEYLGSPYQISLAEAQQEKQLVILDAFWQCEKRIPLDLGRRHFKVSSWDELMQLKLDDGRPSSTLESKDSNTSLNVVRKGDRIVATVTQKDRRRLTMPDDEDSHLVSTNIQAFRDQGVAIEIRDAPNLDPTGLAETGSNDLNGPLPEDLSPESTWRAYLEEGFAQENISDDDRHAALLQAGLEILESIEAGNGDEDVSTYRADQLQYDLRLSSVSVQGFGPFQRKVTYPLGDRGLVLLRGSTSDVGSDSNGSGKSSLAMATLWGLTGSLDTRPGQDGKVSDVVNDNSKEARVTVEGSINEIPFVVSRSKTASKGNLFFQLDGVDMTTQSVKETQAVVEEKLGVDSHILGRAVFHGQHIINDLLESTDTKLKDELSLLVPLDLWQQASSVARSKSRQARKKCDELSGMVRLRSGDVDALSRRADVAKEKWHMKEKGLQSAKLKLEEEMNEAQNLSVEENESAPTSTMQSDLEQLSSEIRVITGRYESMMKERDSDLQPLNVRLAQAVETASTLGSRTAKLERNSLTCTMSVQSAQRRMEQVEKQWSVDLSSGIPTILVPPEVCPTCRQPLDAGGSHDHHHLVQETFEREIEDAVKALNVAQNAVDNSSREESQCAEELVQAESLVTSLTSDLQQLTSEWDEKLLVLDEDIRAKRSAQTELTSQLAASFKASQLQMKLNSAMASIGLEQLAVDHAREGYESIKAEVLSAKDVLIRLEEEKYREERIADVMAEVGERFGQRGVQTFVLKNVVVSLQRMSQIYLNQLSDGGQRLELSLEAGDKIARTAFIQGPDGEFKVRPLSTLSGGQWRRCSLAMSFAFADLMAKRGRFRSSLLVLDEPLTHLDRSGRTRFGEVVRNLVVSSDDSRSDFGMSTVLVILQDLAAEELEEAFDSIDTVVRQGGDSRVEVDGLLESEV